MSSTGTRRLPVVGRLGGVRDGAFAVIDQGLSSGSGLLLVALLARAGPADVFGALTMVLLVQGFLFGCYRAMVCEIAMLRRRRAGADGRTGTALFIAVVAGAVSAVVLLAGAAVVGGEVGSFLVVVAVSSPFVYVQDVLRYLAYADRDVTRAVALDGCWLAVQVVASAVLLAAGDPSPTALAMAWAAGAAVSAAWGVLTARRRPTTAGLRSWRAEDGARALGFLADFAVSTGVSQASFLIVGLFMPLEEFGAFRLAFVAVSPLANIVAGVRVLVLSRLAGSESSEALRAATRSGLGFAAIAVVYGVVITALPEPVGVGALGPIWAETRVFLPFVVLVVLCRVSAFPAIDLLKVFDTPRVLVRTRIVATCSYLIGMLAGAATNGPLGAVVGLAIVSSFVALLWWHRARSVPDRCAPSVVPAGAGSGGKGDGAGPPAAASHPTPSGPVA